MISIHQGTGHTHTHTSTEDVGELARGRACSVPQLQRTTQDTRSFSEYICKLRTWSGIYPKHMQLGIYEHSLMGTPRLHTPTYLSKFADGCDCIYDHAIQAMELATSAMPSPEPMQAPYTRVIKGWGEWAVQRLLFILSALAIPVVVPGIFISR